MLAFDKSDILFVCMLAPLSYEIAIDDKEIQAAMVSNGLLILVFENIFYLKLII